MNDLRTKTLQQQQQQQQRLIPIEEQSLAGESKFNPSETSVGECSLIGNSEFQQLVEEAEEIYNRTRNNKISPIQSSPSQFPIKSLPSGSLSSRTGVLTPNTLRENGKTLLSPPRLYENKNDDNGKDNDGDSSDSDFSSDFEDIDPISRVYIYIIFYFIIYIDINI